MFRARLSCVALLLSLWGGAILGDVILYAPINSGNGLYFDPVESGTANMVMDSYGLAVGSNAATQRLSVNGNITVEGNGIAYPGSARPMKSIILHPVEAAYPTGGAEPTLTPVTGGNQLYTSLDFGPNSDTYLFWNWLMPDSYSGGNVVITLYWKSLATSGTAVFVASCGKVASGESVDAVLSTSKSDQQSAPSTSGAIRVDPFAEFSPGWTAGAIAVLKLMRDADHASDTLTQNAGLIKVKIEYPVSAETD